MSTTEKYGDIIHLPHPVSEKHPRMPMQDRAAQFSPFAALTGYEEAIYETGRLTEERAELDEEEKAILDRKQRLLLEKLDEFPALTFTYFVPDEKKSGGRYITKTGNLKKLHLLEKWMLLTDGTKIPLEDVKNIESPLFCHGV